MYKDISNEFPQIKLLNKILELELIVKNHYWIIETVKIQNNDYLKYTPKYVKIWFCLLYFKFSLGVICETFNDR